MPNKWILITDKNFPSWGEWQTEGTDSKLGRVKIAVWRSHDGVYRFSIRNKKNERRLGSLKVITAKAALRKIDRELQ